MFHYLCKINVNISIFSSLKDRQDKWRREEKERMARQPDPSVPPGHTMMPSKERLHTLEVLQESKY